MIKNMMKDRMGSVIISLILGLGLAALFRRACTGGSCIVVKAPKREDLQKYYYKVDDNCFKYTPYVVECDSKKKTPSA
jgi:hypothetical protein